MEDYRILIIHGYKGGTEEVKVDAEDYDYLSKWSWKRSSPRGYARRTVRKKGGRGYTTLYMHHLIIGDMTKELVVDHINGDPLDNRKKNLRTCSQSENLVNRHIVNGKCQHQGVTEHYGKYQARINRNKIRIYLGRYDTVEEASEAIHEYDKQHGLLM